MNIKTVEREKYSEYQLENIAKDTYDETVKVLGMEMDALRIIKELDIPYYAELLEGLQEYETKYLCPTCKSEYDTEEEALECNQYPSGFSHASVIDTDNPESDETEEGE